MQKAGDGLNDGLVPSCLYEPEGIGKVKDRIGPGQVALDALAPFLDDTGPISAAAVNS